LFTSGGDGVCFCVCDGLLVFAWAFVASGLGVLVSVPASVSVWSAVFLLTSLTLALALMLTLTLALPLPVPPTITPLSLLPLMLGRALPTMFAELPAIKELMVLLVFGNGGGRGCMSLCWVMWTLDSRLLLLVLPLLLFMAPSLVFDLCVLVLAGVTGSVRWR